MRQPFAIYEDKGEVEVIHIGIFQAIDTLVKANERLIGSSNFGPEENKELRNNCELIQELVLESLPTKIKVKGVRK